MAQANPAPEPSMEEILASIRRIIEGDEEFAETDGGASEASDSHGMSVIADASPAHSVPASPAPDSADRSDGPRPAEKVEAMSKQSYALPEGEQADLTEDGDDAGSEHQASLKDTQADPAGEEPQDVTDQPETYVQPGVEAAIEDGDVDADRLSTARAADPEERGDLSSKKLDEPKPEQEDLAQSHAGLETDEDPAPSSHGATPESVEERPLMSAVSEARVVAAFDALAASVLARKMPPLDAVAETILRPMLRGWLDEHLPGMVERLVREEIARLAEGEPDDAE